MLLFNLHGTHATDGLFSLNPFLLAGLQDLLVLDTQLATLNVEAVQGCYNGIGVYRLTEVGKGQSTEGTLLVEVVVEGVWSGNGEGRLAKAV